MRPSGSISSRNPVKMFHKEQKEKAKQIIMVKKEQIYKDKMPIKKKKKNQAHLT